MHKLSRAFIAEIRDFPVTIALCLLYVGLFVLMAIAQGRLDTGQGPLALFGLSIDTLVDFGAVDGKLVLDQGQWWRLITATFLHGSIPHVVLNVLALYQLGRIIEDWYGGSTLVLLHVLLGLAGSLVSLWMHRMMPGRVVQVGGSGAIFGFAAFLLVAAYFDDHEESPLLFRSLVTALLIGFGMGYLLGADNAAHVGGALAGAVMGTFDNIFKREFMPRIIARLLGIISIGVIIVSFSFCGRAYADQVEERDRIKIQRQRELEKKVEEFNLARARGLLMRIYSYAYYALRRKDLPPLDHRRERADLLDHTASQLRDKETVEYLHRIAKHLRIEPDEEFASKDNLEAMMRLFAEGPHGMSQEPDPNEEPPVAPPEDKSLPLEESGKNTEPAPPSAP